MTTRPRRLRRSELSTPGWSEKMIAKAAGSAADLVFLDLEDSVAPAQKPAARTRVATALRELDWAGKTRAVRINSPGTEWAHDDLATVVVGAGGALDVVIVPKVKSADDVRWVDEVLTELATEAEGVGGIGIEVLIEEVEGLLAVEQIAVSSTRLEALIFGSGDLAASQGVRTSMLDDYPGDLWIYHRTRIALAASAAGIAAIDGPYWGAISDTEGYRAECVQASIIGFTGKWAIHPSQVEIANQAFAPSEEEVSYSRRVIAACSEAEADGRGAISIDGVMVDAADVRIAAAVLARAELAGGAA
jgi:citrate lyase subunit beta / citryl-CoA lyase